MQKVENQTTKKPLLANSTVLLLISQQRIESRTQAGRVRKR